MVTSLSEGDFDIRNLLAFLREIPVDVVRGRIHRSTHLIPEVGMEY